MAIKFTSVAYVVLHLMKRKTNRKKNNINKGKKFLVYTCKAYVYTICSLCCTTHDKKENTRKKKQKKENNINKGKKFLVYTCKAYVYTKKNKKIIDLKTAPIEI